MRAVVVREYGGPEALRIVETPLPEPGPGQVRIKVEAAAVNIVDVATRIGMMTSAGLVAARPEHGLGWDVAGTVDASQVPGFAPGDRVAALSDRLDRSTAAYAEYIVLDAGAVAHIPGSLGFAEAATIPLNGLTALQGLDLLAGFGLAPGDTLLVTGAAGAVGGYAVELAALRGLRVVAVAGPDDEKQVRAFGAEHFVPRQEELGEAVRAVVPGGVDGALDAAAIGVRALDAVRNGGSLAAVLDHAAPPALRGTRVAKVWVRADGRQLAELIRLVEQGRLTTRVAGTLPLARAGEAQERLAAGGVRGRLVLLPQV
ncbi:NADPH:quinone reductase-like Zn-dependent oxidoreductase [Thermocatellispora tengchongensis]|uniref:NADPH:quinone reductase-like Zn-dependent oxidoreductase n=1 Tax=Thermocatellispora tengchongensis TaxID=1073253 RepID=A0A840P325_9ACTN|nr:NADP-dependent oxidoreductase [Thermocatellispora tengchongensis]MBB5130445.1 NADPH:quinone reductase-like Zn-dependent oxidoreductase [Thermocatellispora tengchongensis]